MKQARGNSGGSAEFQRLVANADLSKGEKSVLHALLVYADWFTGGVIGVTVATIAAAAGFKLRQTQIHLRSLESKGAIVGEWSRGGYSADGRPRTHQIKVCKEGLMKLAKRYRGTPRHQGPPDTDPDGPNNHANNHAFRDREPCIPRQPTAHSPTPNPAANAHNQSLLYQPEKQSTSTKQPALTSDPGGGGGGNSSLLRSSEPVRQTPDEAEPAIANAIGFRRLIEFKVNAGVARELASTRSLEVIEAGIRLVRESKSIRDPAAALVVCLRDGTAEEAHVREEKRARRATEERLMEARRFLAVQVFQRFKSHLCGEQREELLRMHREIWGAYRDPTAIASSGVLTDAEWHASVGHEIETFRLLHARIFGASGGERPLASKALASVEGAV